MKEIIPAVDKSLIKKELTQMFLLDKQEKVATKFIF